MRPWGAHSSAKDTTAKVAEACWWPHLEHDVRMGGKFVFHLSFQQASEGPDDG